MREFKGFRCWQPGCDGLMISLAFGITTNYARCDKCRFCTKAYRTEKMLMYACGLMATIARAKTGGPKIEAETWPGE